MEHRLRTNAETGERYLLVGRSGVEVLKDPLLNKGSAFSRDERDALGLRGLLPDSISTIEQQVERVWRQYRAKESDLAKNIYLNGLMDRNETLFHRFVLDYLEETVPIIYTPTVAHACSHWSHIFRRARGIYVTPRDRGRIRTVLQSRPAGARPVIVATDNERILGIGDQGAGGMGIPIGKLALYAVAAGIHPSRCVPVSLDVGTNNEELLSDPQYLGYRSRRITGDEYQSLVDEFVDAVIDAYPGALLQWEDFSNRTSFTNLERYQDRIASFNDDIQGTAAMAVAGLLVVARHGGTRMREQRVVIAGSGSAGIGIRDQVIAAMVADGAEPERATRSVFSLDSTGLLIEGRRDMTPAKARLAVPADAIPDTELPDHPMGLLDVVRTVEPTVLIGVSGQGSLFDRQVVEALAARVDQPVIMPMSNPTSHAEVTPTDAIVWTGGRAFVASGSPFPPVTFNGDKHHVGQANNVFIFPGMGLGALTVGARRITTGMFLAAAEALAGLVDSDLYKRRQLYPSITSVRDVSYAVGVAVAERAVAEGEAEPRPDLREAVAAEMWWPEYPAYRPA